MAVGARSGADTRAVRRAWLVLAQRSPGLPSGRLTAGSEISASGANASVPETWIGRSVELMCIPGASKECTNGIFQEVNDRGIVLSVNTHVWHPAQSLFYPRSAVIRLSEEQDG